MSELTKEECPWLHALIEQRTDWLVAEIQRVGVYSELRDDLMAELRLAEGVVEALERREQSKGSAEEVASKVLDIAEEWSHSVGQAKAEAIRVIETYALQRQCHGYALGFKDGELAKARLSIPTESSKEVKG